MDKEVDERKVNPAQASNAEKPAAKPAEKKPVSAPGTSGQYLYALIRCAEWVPDTYKKLAEAQKTNVEYLKELYLCACDGVSERQAEAAQEKKPLEGALRYLRKHHLEEAVAKGYSKELSMVKQRASEMEREVRQMKSTVEHLSSRAPGFREMFPEQDPPGDAVLRDIDELSAKPKDSASDPTDRAETSGDVPESGTHTLKIRAFHKKPRWKKEKEMCISEYIEQLLKEGYSEEQLNYLLDCIEDEVPVTVIQRFASPSLPVGVMMRLRRLEERKEKKNG